MLTIQRLGRLASHGSHDRLLSDVLRNGRPLPLGARLRLSDPETLPAAALGLALRRLVELTHRPGPGAAGHAGALLDLQDGRGRFGTALGTAAALAGLTSLLDQHARRPGALAPDFVARLEMAVEQGVYVLFEAQHGPGSEESPGLVGDALETALVLWLVGELPALREAIRAVDLVESIRRGESDLDVDAVLALCPLAGGSGGGGARKAA